MFKNILLAADASKHSLHAAKTAGDMARAMQSSTLCIIVPFPPVPVFLGEPNFDKVAATRMIEAEAVVKSMQKEIGTIPGEIQIEILEGYAAEAILKVSETHHTDLIVMGSSSLGTLGHLLAGDQSHKVVSRAHCPVMIVR